MNEEKGLIQQHEALLAKQAETAESLTKADAQKQALADAHQQAQEAVDMAKKAATEAFHAERKALLKDVEAKIWQLVSIFLNLLRAKV